MTLSFVLVCFLLLGLMSLISTQLFETRRRPKRFTSLAFLLLASLFLPVRDLHGMERGPDYVEGASPAAALRAPSLTPGNLHFHRTDDGIGQSQSTLAPTKVTIVPQVRKAADPYEFLISVAPVDGNAVPTGSVSIVIDGGEVQQVTLADGRARYSAPLTKGTHKVVVTYSGDAQFGAASTQIVMVITGAQVSGASSSREMSEPAARRARFSQAIYRPGKGARFLLTDAYPYLIQGIWVAPGTTVLAGTTATFTAGVESSVYGTPQNGGIFACGPNFGQTCANGPGFLAPSMEGHAQWWIDGVAVSGGDEDDQDSPYECGEDDSGHPMYCDSYVGNLTYSTVLPLGSHTVQVQYIANPGSYFGQTNSVQLSQNVNVQATVSNTISSSANPIYATQNVTFTCNSSSVVTPTGSMDFWVDGSVRASGSLVNGAATWTTNNLTLGNHTVGCSGPNGNSNFIPAGTQDITVSVNQASSQLSLSCSPATLSLGDSTTCMATVSVPNGVTATGTVAFYSPTTLTGQWWNGNSGFWYPSNGGNIQSSPLAISHDGSLNYNLNNSGSPGGWAGAQIGGPAGLNHDYVYARWAGTFRSDIGGTYTIGVNSDDGANVYVNGTKLVNNLGAGQAAAGDRTLMQSGTINLSSGAINTIVVEFQQGLGDAGIQLLWIPPGQSSPSLLGWTLVPLDQNNHAYVTGSILAPGVSTVNAIYSGDTNVASSSATTTTNATTRTVLQLASDRGTTGYGQNVAFSAVVNTGGAAPTGNLSFRDGASQIANVGINRVTATNLIPYSQQIGSWSWGGYCGPLNSLSANTSDVAAPDGSYTASKFVVPNTSGCAGVGAQGAIAPIAGGLIAGQPYTASIWFRAAVAGTHVILGVDDCHSQEFTVDTTWRRYTYTVASYSNCNPERGLQFLSWDKNATYYVWGAQTEQTQTAGPYILTDASTRSGYGGVATFNTSTLGLGNHSIVASYAGDSVSSAATSSPITQTVLQPVTTPTILLTASPTPLVAGASVQITGTIKPTSATGFLSFSVDGTPTGATGTLVNGSYSISVAGLGAGLHSIAATYSGDGTYYSATTSVPLGLLVVAQTSISLSSSRIKELAGNPVTFTASVSPSGATGNLVFYSNGTQIGTVSVSNGTGAITVSNLGLGTQSITVHYEGDSKYLGVTSTALNQQIITLPPVTVTRIAGTGTYGDSGDGGQALSANVSAQYMVMDADENIFFVNVVPSGGYVIREMMASDNTIHQVAGTGNLPQQILGSDGYDSDPDGPNALSTTLAPPIGMVADRDGNLYYSEQWGGRTRKINPKTGSIQTININKGNPGQKGFITVDHQNRVIYAQNCQYFRQDQVTNQIELIAGTYKNIQTWSECPASSGDGGLAVNANISMGGPYIDPYDNIYFNDSYYLRKIDASTGIISRLAGDGLSHNTWNATWYNAFSGDGGDASQAPTLGASPVVDSNGNIFLGTGFDVIREIFAGNNIIDRVAGKVGISADDTEGKLPLDTTFPGIGDILVDHLNYVYLNLGNRIVRFGSPKQPTHITWPTPSSISSSTPLSAVQLNATTGVAGTYTYSPAAGTTLPQGVQTLSVTFQPTDTAHYLPSQATVKILVNNLAMPTVTWAQPAAITYPQDLTPAQLNASSNVPGKFVYIPALHTVLNAGTQTLVTKLVPNDMATYNIGYQTTTITVNPGTPIVSWPSPAAISTGTALSNAQLNATANVPGTFSYSPGAGAVLSAGTNTLSVTFTPSSSNYVSRTITTQISVSNGAPAPVIRAINPDPAMINQQVTIYGSGFGSPVAGSSLKFNGVSASYSSWTDTSITATVPAGAATGNVIVNNGSAASNPFLLVISGVCQ